ncbi:MAG: hypothetical protein CSA11_05565 [Chloroflexi bacterium]|nr:MAG: hypothetical protein CSB13_05160 [Chloroflexota bacterium]PIE81238.1 MAG: hypothetical protein CSA11_05565 [Chloroflexota bacterium]
MKVIYLDSEDDIVSICDQLDWAGDAQVLLVLPEDGGVLAEGLDLVRLRRHADRIRVEVGLVTAVSMVTRPAKSLGLPTFVTVEAAQSSRRGWWRGRKRSETVGLPTMGGVTAKDLRPKPMDAADKREAKRRSTPLTSPSLWTMRYLSIILFFLAMALVVVAFSYLVPGATVTLSPVVEPISVTQQILVDPYIEQVDYGRSAVPGRILQVAQSWQTDVETSGVIEVPSASARGKVVFANRLEEDVTVPAGTRVSTSEGSNVVFQTLTEVVVPGVEGGTAEADIIAIEPGYQGNVDINLINKIEGALDIQLEVRNLEPTTGGGVRETPAVTEADQERLRSQVLQFLQAASVSEMEAELSEREFMARDSLRVVNVDSETFSHFPGEQTNRVALEMRAQVAGTAVNTTDASGIVYEALAAQVPRGHTLVPESIKFASGDVIGVDDAGRVTFEMIGEAVVAPDLELGEAVEMITGQQPEIAVAYLYQELPLRELPEITVFPNWFNRLPFLSTRIEMDVRLEP